MVHRVVALAVPPQSPFEMASVAQVFGVEHPDAPARYAFTVCAETPGPVEVMAGCPLFVEHGLEAMDEADTVIVTGWPDHAARPSGGLVEGLRAAHARGARVVGLCSGAFALAGAGLLDGRAATTHWRMADELAALYPKVDVRQDELYVDHGDVATSAGTGAAVDLALALVRRDFGAAHAAEIARHMVLPPHRDGGQRQYSRLAPEPEHPAEETLAKIVEWAEANLHRPITVADMAAQGAVSARTLARLFERGFGVAPGRWLLRRRIETARTMLERTDATVDAVASACGFADPSNFRRRFAAETGTTPGRYRRVFSTSGWRG
ncbi:GlxA family transcriptional regulator [Actinomadura rupiterrae]|uniref:GlxA family transcriptional regulator n=1 Tax=Actinomadura rupiterrae TaxID=559627 RepID=UPI0020A3D75E|nr:helix-turn-helix domain-containing protein [Actinomadura rupiterrae]MCP2335629.1 AraC family transcriptional activator FtrA [Actinomadura rupiterrae]